MIVVSVIIALHKSMATIGQTIKSLRRQTLSDFECLLVDDWSEDKVADEFKKHTEGDSRFYYIPSRMLSGVGATWNIGMMHSSGNFIQFLNPGDLLMPDALTSRAALLSKNTWETLAGVQSLSAPISDKDILGNGAFLYDPCLAGKMEADQVCSVFFRRQALTNSGGFNEFASGDASFAMFLKKLSSLGYGLLDSGVLDCFYGAGHSHYEIRSHKANLGEKELDDRSSVYALNPAASPSSLVLAGGDSSDHPESSGVDILFFPHKDYHVVTILALQGELEKRGVTFASLDLSNVYRDEAARPLILAKNMRSASFPEFLLGAFAPKTIAVFNDWDPDITRNVAECAKEAGIPAIGVVEGVQDYLDVDTGANRKAYKTVSHVITPCRYDRKYFDPAKQRIYEGSIPRIRGLAADAKKYHYNPDGPVVINANFSYKTKLNEIREMWVSEAVKACQELGKPYMVSRHPFDTGKYAGVNITKKSMYEAIWESSVFVSRFGSGIIEAIAMGRPPIYFNPHNEKIDKFKDPLGAFRIANSREELKRAIVDSISGINELSKHWDTYLQTHAGYNRCDPKASIALVADALEQAVASADKVTARQTRLFVSQLAKRFQKNEVNTLKNVKLLK